MSFYAEGNPPVNSTTGLSPVVNPSTSSLIAEVDSTQLGTAFLTAGQKRQFRVTWLVGATTNATFQLEQVESTALISSTNPTTVIAYSPTNQSAQYITNHDLIQNSRLRVRLNSTFTGSASAYIQAEAIA